MNAEIKKHWETIYQTKHPNEVSWTEEKLSVSLDLIQRTYIGYVYEMPTTIISKVSNQTHELALRFFILKDKNDKEEKPAKSK